MATATATRSKKSDNGDRPAPKLILPVQFGDVSIGDGTCAVGVTIQRAHLTIADADESLCCKRLVGKILILPGGDDEDQSYIDDAQVKYRVQGAFDVRSFRVTPKTLSTRLTFSIESIDIEELSHFAKKSGKLVADLITGIPEEEKSDAKGQKTLPLEGPADEQDIAVLSDDLSVAVLKRLRDRNITTMGKLSALIKLGPEDFQKVAGKQNAAAIENACFEYYGARRRRGRRRRRRRRRRLGIFYPQPAATDARSTRPMIIHGYRFADGTGCVEIAAVDGDMPIVFSLRESLLRPHPLRPVPFVKGAPAFNWGEHCPAANVLLAAALLRLGTDDATAVHLADDFAREVVLEFHPLGWSLWPEAIGEFVVAKKECRGK